MGQIERRDVQPHTFARAARAKGMGRRENGFFSAGSSRFGADHSASPPDGAGGLLRAFRMIAAWGPRSAGGSGWRIEAIGMSSAHLHT